jgi:hypothetical protein
MLPYPPRTPDIIKSVRQRWLFGYWSRLRGERTLPLWSELDMAELDSCFDDLSILDVVGDDGSLRFRIFDHGKNVGAMYAGQCAGKFLDDVLPVAAREYTLETYEHTARVRMPVYTASKVTDADLRPVLYERMLLPFSHFGDKVSRIIGFLETISPAGAFERQELMTDPQAGNGFALKVVLQAPAG